MAFDPTARSDGITRSTDLVQARVTFARVTFTSAIRLARGSSL
jgi:hypothetical protein